MFSEDSQTPGNTGQNHNSNRFSAERNANPQQKCRNQMNFNEFLRMDSPGLLPIQSFPDLH
jgi:hypothetical protein